MARQTFAKISMISKLSAGDTCFPQKSESLNSPGQLFPPFEFWNCWKKLARPTFSNSSTISKQSGEHHVFPRSGCLKYVEVFEKSWRCQLVPPRLAWSTFSRIPRFLTKTWRLQLIVWKSWKCWKKLAWPTFSTNSKTQIG